MNQRQLNFPLYQRGNCPLSNRLQNYSSYGLSFEEFALFHSSLEQTISILSSLPKTFYFIIIIQIDINFLQLLGDSNLPIEHESNFSA